MSRAPAGSSPRVATIALAAAAFLALSVSFQIYLAMADHGHAFWRLVAWQGVAWGFWAAATPALCRMCESWGDGAPNGRQIARIAIAGAVLVTGHLLASAVIFFWLQPYVPIQRYRFGESAGHDVQVADHLRPAGLHDAAARRPRHRGGPPCPAARDAGGAARDRRGAGAPRSAAPRDPAALPVQHPELDRRADPHPGQRSGAQDAARPGRADAGDDRSDAVAGHDVADRAGLHQGLHRAAAGAVRRSARRRLCDRARHRRLPGAGLPAAADRRERLPPRHRRQGRPLPARTGARP